MFKKNKTPIILLLWGFFLFYIPSFSSFGETLKADSFSFHLNQEPATLNPSLTTSSSSYLLGNLYRNLYRFDQNSDLQFELAETCTPLDKKNKFTCTLKKNLQWSDGTPLVAQDFINSYQWILSSENKSPRADSLFSIKNAKSFYLKNSTWNSVGLKAPNDNTLIFELDKSDLHFKYKLALLNTSPVKKNSASKNQYDEFLFSGPYKIIGHEKQKKYLLTPHTPYFKALHLDHLPPTNVQVLILSDESTALKLYEKNELQFLRRLPSLYIPKYKDSVDYLSQPVLRFDYFGFSINTSLELRKALALSLDYSELQKIFSSEGIPGCPGIPTDWSELNKFPCHTMDLTEAQKSLKNIPKYLLKNIMLYFSQQGGEDHRRAAEWMQNQWKTKLNLNVKIQSFENQVFNEMIRTKSPTLFRKGVSLDTPLCEEALQIFTTNHPENFMKFSDPTFDSLVEKMMVEKKQNLSKKFCNQGIQYLMSKYIILPTGPIHFAMLVKSNIKGLTVNSLNQLDLSRLEMRK